MPCIKFQVCGKWSITLKPLPGTHIEKACVDAVLLATTLCVNVKFRFNGIDMEVDPRDSSGSAMSRYDNLISAAQEKYRREEEAAKTVDIADAFCWNAR